MSQRLRNAGGIARTCTVIAGSAVLVQNAPAADPASAEATLEEVVVRGYRALEGINRHIRCYVAYYAKPNGEIHAWNPQSSSVPTAMASRTPVGSYREQVASTANGEVQYAAL